MGCNANLAYGGGQVSLPPPPNLEGEVDKCHYLPAKFGGGGGQMSLPPPPNLAVDMDKCLYLPRQLLVDGPTNLKSDF